MKERVAIVGAGIVGLAHAWSAAERGHEVTVYERTKVASGASIRNFGMVWPIGQPAATRGLALLSRERWLTLTQESRIWANPYGSLHLAHRADEWSVLQEYYELQRNTELGTHLKLLSCEEAFERSPGINPVGFLGALDCDLEICVNPTETIRKVPGWLMDRYEVQFKFETAVAEVATGRLKTATGQLDSFDRIVICSGHDLETLYPEQFVDLPLKKCKLQMLRTVSQPNQWKLGAHLASGLTLRHYESFQECSSLAALVQRIAAETPELNRFGIHVMASQDNHGRVVLGDSHEYGDEIEPFDSMEIDQLILRELQKIIRLPSWDLERRWHGIYAKNTGGAFVSLAPEAGVYICTGLGGAGMTMSFGVAEHLWRQWDNAATEVLV
ncbi:MAG: TIGR03364 family FAD-dependent oxidoreductase [Planctomycetaceae bacterium]|nr:TIGR03364 family FAD-dependent oxidoreductase [Planctomycetaceae bacterium]